MLGLHLQSTVRGVDKKKGSNTEMRLFQSIWLVLINLSLLTHGALLRNNRIQYPLLPVQQSGLRFSVEPPSMNGDTEEDDQHIPTQPVTIKHVHGGDTIIITW